MSTALESEWWGALNDGLSKLHATDLIAPADRRFVYYGWVFEAGSRASLGCQYGSTGLPYERPEFSLATSAIVQYFTTGDRNDAVNWMRRMADRVIGDPEIVTTQLADVTKYHDDFSVQCEVDSELRNLLDSARAQSRPLVIVAHSLGALVLFHTLMLMPDNQRPHILRIITIGSPLGAHHMPSWILQPPWILRYIEPDSLPIRQRIIDNWRKGAVAPLADSWINVVGRDDQIAFPLDSGIASRLADTTVNLYVDTRPGDQHWFGGYLKHPLVAAAVIGPWCAGRTELRCFILPKLSSSTTHAPPAPYLLRMAVGGVTQLGAFTTGPHADSSLSISLAATLVVTSTLVPLYPELTVPMSLVRGS